MDKQVILIVDDEALNLSVLMSLLKHTYSVRACKTGEDALATIGAGLIPDLILLDIVMPGIDGFTVLKKLQDSPKTKEIPVIFISALDSFMDEEKGFELGAVDYIAKPFRAAIVMMRVKAQLELKQARDILKNQNQWLETEIRRRMKESRLIQEASLIALTQLVETRDQNTGNHILRTHKYMEVLARYLQKNEKYAEALCEKNLQRMVKASPLHDIGKIGIPDCILLKPERLTKEEFEIIKTHTSIGGEAFQRVINQSLKIDSGQTNSEKESSLEYLEEAGNIAKHHHERWDGTGYPDGLAGEEIPLSARLMAFADVFDALTTERPYKNAWTMEETMEYMLEQKGKHFDPDVVEAFIKQKANFEKILYTLSDDIFV